MAAAVQPVLETTANVLEVRDLSVQFRTPKGPVMALRKVSVAVPRGSIVGLVGESGSGKSTLALAVMRLMPANATITEGSLRFAGRELLTLPALEMQRLRGDRLSMVFQDPMTSLNPVRSVGMQMVDIQYRDRQMSQADKRRRAADMLRGSASRIPSISSTGTRTSSPAACDSASRLPWASWRNPSSSSPTSPLQPWM